jgi:hypothetical protein
VIVLALAGVLAAVAADALPLRTFSVDPAGDDAADGSAARPWRTLQHAADTVRAGDLVVVRTGRYAGFHLETSGTAVNPITFRAEPGAIVDTRNPVTPDGLNLEGASHVVVEGFTLLGLPRAGLRAVLNRHVTFRGNTGDLNGRWGILTGFSDDLLIEDNVMSRSQAEHGIYVSNSGDRPIIRRNVVWGNRANGIHLNGDLSQGGDGIISGALVEANTIYDNGLGGGSGINADGVQASVFRNNLLYGNHASGISLYRIDGAAGSRDNVVVHNTIVQAADGRWALNIQNGSTGTVVRNNVLYNHHAFRGSIAVSADSLPGLVSDGNVVMDRFSMDGGNTRVGLAAWRSATGQDLDSIVATPAALFVDAPGGDFHLSATSPARDAGQTLPEVAEDLEGAPRPQGVASDIGAYESPDAPALLTLIVMRAGSGTVASVPAGIDCGATCAAAFPAGTGVTLAATPAAGWVFAGWAGGGCGGTGACLVVLGEATAVTATFTPAPASLTVVRAGLGAGSVTSAPAGIACGAACSASFTSGTTVTLTGEAAPGSIFTGWTGGGCAGTSACAVTLTTATTLTATFEPASIPLTVTLLGAGPGLVTSVPGGLACAAACATSLPWGTVVTLTAAVPEPGGTFAGWGGACAGTAPTCTVTLDQARAVTARFVRVFADPDPAPLDATVRAAHFTELRDAIAVMRARHGLPVSSWTDAALVAGTTMVRLVHLTEVRSALAAVFGAVGQTSPAWSDAGAASGVTPIRAVHLIELRAAVRALE